ncbi:MAG TPA: DUF2950 domain-containing protein [Blastocatellia bacterium]|nr:DUF2950 domain-containing protein [Blastocatellia bacterium]
MKSSILRTGTKLLRLTPVALAVVCFLVLLVTAQTAKHAAAGSTASGEKFATAKQAADALVDAAEKYDVEALDRILGPDAKDIIHTGEPAREREVAAEFAKQARKKSSISPGKNPQTAFLVIGDEDWPFPLPIVKTAGKWSFDAKAGKKEILYRRIGRNELDAIQICRGYVEAQHEYALQKRSGYDVNQYAQRIISTPGKQDGLAWQTADGKWEGPIGENVAKAIQRGYSNRNEPFHGYFFKILKGQGPAAPLGQMDFVIKGVMIGGFALVAAPAEYGSTGVKSFMVSHDGVVYEKDLGPESLKLFAAMERFNPDKTWTPVKEE